jgi:iron complex outermembrane recepter protein
MKTTANHPRSNPLALAAALVVGLWSAAAFAQAVKVEDAAPAPKDDTIRLGTITITGSGERLGAGQMLNEDASKARSTVTRAATEKNRATENAYQALSLLPGVNTFSHDATGLYGGGLTIRGFNSDQLGFTVNGVPVNDSGNFAVYPQEYADQENLCTQTVTQGSPDVESPHVGATGGNVGLTSCDPEDNRRVRFSQTLGGLNLSRSFVRYDTGKFADGKAKVFLSYSHTQADKWKGKGEAKRDHLDAAFSYDITPDNRILGSILYNRAINSNINSISLADINNPARGYFYDFSETFTPGHLTPANGTRQAETGPTPAYYKLSNNPFENVVASLSGSFKLSNDVLLKVQPYLWYGYGNGGVQQRTVNESNSFLEGGALTGDVDLNGDGDTLDTIVMARSSVTKTSRPGITTEFNIFMGNHQIRAGVWYERADHRQTQPLVKVNDDGSSTDVWHKDGVIRRPDGTAYQGRDTHTISTSYQLYVSDAINVLDNKGLLTVGVRAPKVTRDVTNNANEGGTTAYTLQQSFSEVLPQIGLRYELAKGQQVFINVAKNFRAPPNFAFFPGTAISIVNGVGTLKAETSVVSDLGYRFQSREFSFSANFFNVAFNDRQATAFDTVTNISTYTNIGKVSNRGFELELGTAIFGGVSVYASLTSQKSEIKSDFARTATQIYPTAGKELPLTPKLMAGLAVQYAQGAWYARVKGKLTGSQWADMMNNERVPSYITADLDAGYRLGELGFLKSAQLRLNVSNLTGQRYRSSSSGQAILSTAAVGALPANGSVFYYLGAPRLTSLTFSGDF